MAGFELDVSLSRSIRNFFQVIRIEKKEVSSIYFYAILSGLIQLSLPLGIQAIINFAQAAAGRGKLPASMWLLIILVVGGVFIAGLLQVNQMRLVEKIQQRIFSRYAFEFTFKIPRLKVKETENYYLPELVNRFFDSVSLQKSLSKLLLDIPLAIIQIFFGLILLSIYNAIFILLGLILLVVVLLVLFVSAKRGLEASLAESNYKYSLMGWIQELARGFKTFKISDSHHLHLKKTDLNLKLQQSTLEIENKVKSSFNDVISLQKQAVLFQQNLYNQELLLRAEESKFSIGESSMFLVNARENKLLETQQKLNELKAKFFKSLLGVVWSTGQLK